MCHRQHWVSDTLYLDIADGSVLRVKHFYLQQQRGGYLNWQKHWRLSVLLVLAWLGQDWALRIVV
jgi:hypothetical protein